MAVVKVASTASRDMGAQSGCSRRRVQLAELVSTCPLRGLLDQRGRG